MKTTVHVGDRVLFKPRGYDVWTEGAIADAHRNMLKVKYKWFWITWTEWVEYDNGRVRLK